MDKQMIEKIAIEEYAKARAVQLTRGAERTAVETCKNFLTRIDAERGKEAVAWALFSENGNIRIWTSTPEEVRRLAEDQGMTLSPLFLSPTIPEGMARVPVIPTPAMCAVISNEHDIYGSAQELYAMVLQAAQGERNEK